MFKIVALDDDLTTLHLLKAFLGKEYDLVTFTQPSDLITYLNTKKADLLILDIVLPDINGKQLCSNLRNQSEYDDIPIILLTSKIEESDILSGFYVGADDYIAKPFNPLELKARIQARLRQKHKDGSVLHLKEVELHVATQKVYINKPDQKHEIDLTRMEFKLLQLFLKNPESIYTRRQLLDTLWPDKLNVSDRTVDTHVSNLRKKLKASQLLLESVHGEGYVLSVA